MDVKPIKKTRPVVKPVVPAKTPELPKLPTKTAPKIVKSPKKKPSFIFKLDRKAVFNKKITKQGGVLAGCVAFGLSILFILLYKIGSIPDQNKTDSSDYLGVNSFTKLDDSILFLPQKIVDYILIKLSIDSFVALRVVSVLFCFVALITFFILIKKLISLNYALLATTLLGTSTWVITQSRISTFESLIILLAPAVLLIYLKLNKKLVYKRQLLVFFVLSILFYQPGFIWLFLGLLIFKYKAFIRILNSNDLKGNIVLFSALILPIIPLSYYLATKTETLKSWIGLTDFSNISIGNFISNLADLPSQLAFLGPNNNLIWLHHTPILDAVTIIFAVCGLISFIKDEYIIRSFKLYLLYIIIISLLLIGLSGFIFINLLIVPIYILVAFGIEFLLGLWNSVFPINPLAKSAGLICMCILVASVAYYHVFRYYQAWPKNDDTKAIYSELISDTIDTEKYNSFYLR